MDRMFRNFTFFTLRSSRRIAVPVLTILLLALALSLIAPAAGAAPARPDSGTILEGAKPPEKPAETTAPDLKVTEPAPAVADTTKRIHVTGFRFSGELPVAEADLQQVVATRVGKDLTLNDLNQLAAELTHYLRGRGYMVATAYIPAQTISDGQVEIAVIPGKYGAIIINNRARIGDERLKQMAVGLKEGDIVTKTELERVLLFINDLPGVGVKATMAPGQTAGSTELTLNISDTAKYTSSVYADNWGNRFTGAVRGGFSTGIANLSHSGDALQIGGQHTSGDGLEGFNLGYTLPLGYRGALLAFAYSRIDYTLGKDFAALDVGGDTTVSGMTLSYPFKRSRAGNLYGTIGYDYNDFSDEIGGSTTPKTDRIWKLGLNGNFSDSRRGVNQYALTWFYGDLSIDDDATAAATDSDISNTAGGFNKLALNYRHGRQLTPKYSLDLKFSGQLSDSNLDSSEKLYLGGADGVRAYPQGEAASDQGLLLAVELKRLLPQWSNATNNFYLVGFGDYAYGQINKKLWEDATGDNYRNLADVGLGLGWLRRNFSLRLDYAVKLCGEDAESGTDKKGWIWLQCVRYF
jgi:hemolysin activation/secretion protein